MAVSSPQIQDLEYLYASNANVSNFVSMKLSGQENYHLWKTQMLCLMDTHDMCGLVDDAFDRPKALSIKIMKQYDSLLKGWIFGSVSNGVLGTVVDLGSAKAVWDKLRSSYDRIISAEHVQQETSSQQGEHVQPKTSSQQEEIETERKHTISEDIESGGEDTMAEEVEYKLWHATVNGSWRRVKEILKKDKGLVKKEFSFQGCTVLHLAVSIGHKDLVEKLLLFIKDDEVKDILEQTNEDGSTALHIAVSVGNEHAMKLLVQKHKDLLTMKDDNDQDPLIKAFNNMQFDIFAYLFKAASENKKVEELSIAKAKKTETGASLIVNTITAKQYSTAYDLIEAFPEFVVENDQVLMAIARTFPSHELNYWERAIDPPVPRINHIKKKKEAFGHARKVLGSTCDQIDNLIHTRHLFYEHTILEAAIYNAGAVFSMILRRSRESHKSKNKDGYDSFQLAVIYRSEKIYDYLSIMGEEKNCYRTIKDSFENNMLHLAARLAPSHVLKRRTGAALQLQRELQWFEELKKFMHPSAITKQNMYGETPPEVFTREHENLVKEGETWMKTTAESCSITAALITTIVFAAAITVPGGNNQETGIPMFRKDIAFTIFAISDALSLFTSTSSLMVFLSILTTRFAEKDFLVSLPRRLIIGLCTLLLSITAMMVAFGATLYLLFSREKQWMVGPICGFSCLPILFFVTLQLPLIVDLYRSTYVPIFQKVGYIFR
ncbi:hypothetical protein OSB04_un000071 [Centaurea solstitialis]|uniref:PGG domain-containing protein n=1 Tax=Centaurea solstitialis TaxID=347529 RepID=A0AA38VSA7_9ASTR|nr:hypothetical protein OSB04_un000071 [Centaurea solstitialis]